MKNFKTKNIFTLIFILAVSAGVFGVEKALAAAENHYVTQNGAGQKNGSSSANSWSVTDFNNAVNWNSAVNVDDNKIGPGDKVYFSGTITSRVLLKYSGSSGNPIIFDGYEAGDCDPLNDQMYAATSLTGGMEKIGGESYITVQDFEISGGSSNIPLVNMYDTSNLGYSHVIFRRNYVHDAYGTMAYWGSSSNTNKASYVTVQHNKMIGYGRSSDAVQGLNLARVNDVILSNNILAGTGSSKSTSDNVIEVHNLNRLLIESNDIYGAYKQAGIAIKENDPGVHDVIVRFNKMHDNGDSVEGRAMFIGYPASDHVYVYGNNIYSNRNRGIDVTDGMNYLYIWSNLIRDHPAVGITTYYRTAAGAHLFIYNNTFTRNGTSVIGSDYPHSRTGLYLGDFRATDVNAKNNLFYNNRPNATTYSQVGIINGLTVNLEHNTYFYTGKTPTVYLYGDGAKTIPTLQSSYGLEDDLPAGEVADPGFTDFINGADNAYGTADDNYRLDGTNVNDGASQGQCFDVPIQGQSYHICTSDALDPRYTDWSKSPPTVVTANQNEHGSGWERGAYVYTGGNSDTIAPALPGGFSVR